MYKIELKKDYSIEVECQFSNARLIVFKQGIELGCRDQSIGSIYSKELERALDSFVAPL